MSSIKLNSGIAIKPLNNKTNEELQDLKIKKASKLYESQFLREMVKAMKGTISYSDLRKRSMTEKIYEQKIYENQVDEWTKQGGVGFADIIYKQIKQQIRNKIGSGSPSMQGPISIDQWQGLPINKLQDSSDSNKPTKKSYLEDLKTTGVVFPGLKSNAEILSPWKGSVREARTLPTGTNLVVIEHPGVGKSTMSFGGLLKVKLDQIVAAGEGLGQVGYGGGELTWKLGFDLDKLTSV